MTTPITTSVPSAAASRPRANLVNAGQILRKAAVPALIMLFLCIPIVAFKLDKNQYNILELTPRWRLVAEYVGLTFLGAICIFVVAPLRAGTRGKAGKADTAQAEAPSGAVAYLIERILPILAYGLIGVAIVFPMVAALMSGGLGASRYLLDQGILILTYVMLGWGLNIVVGLAGLLDLGYVAFYAVGAYSYALLSTEFGFSFWLCLPIAGILAAFWGIILGFPILRLRGDYLAIVTLAFGEIIRLVLLNWVDFTNGPNGISSIPRITFFGIPFDRDDAGFGATFGLDPSLDPMYRMVFLYYIILVLAFVTNFVTIRLRRLPIGRAWEALREDEIACRSLGINTRNTKLTAFAIGAMFGGFAGSFFAVRQGLVSPESFNFMESAIILAIVVLGGMGSQVGVAIAAIVLTGLPEVLRHMTFLKQVFGDSFDPNDYRLILFGLGMVAMMIWRPRGLIATRQPSVSIGRRKAITASHVKEGHG